MYIYKCPNEVKLQGGPNYFLSVRGCKGFFVLREFSGALVKCNTKQKLDGAQLVKDWALGNLIIIVTVMALGRYGDFIGWANIIASPIGRTTIFLDNSGTVTIKKWKHEFLIWIVILSHPSPQNFNTNEFGKSVLYCTVLYWGFEIPIPVVKATWGRVPCGPASYV